VTCVVSLYSRHLQGLGRGARVAHVSKSVVAVADVIRTKQMKLWSKYSTISEEDRSQFYFREMRSSYRETSRLDAYMVFVNHFRLQKKLVEYSWLQWRGIDSSTGTAVRYRVVPPSPGSLLLWLAAASVLF
jgi:hypothetical protein